MADTPEAIWSNTDFPYMCLIDERRTLALSAAIERVVKPGDTVVEVGAGAGVLSICAADAGASKVYAVEIEHSMAKNLRATVDGDEGLRDVIEVVEGDAMSVDLPQNVDVVISELMDTGLIDEMQVPVLKRLREAGIIGPDTRVVPEGYRTYVDLVSTSYEFYGHIIKVIKHEWPFYFEGQPNGWHPSPTIPISERLLVREVDFHDIGEPSVNFSSMVNITDSSSTANALRVSGVILLCSGMELGPTYSLNCNKIYPLDQDLEPRTDPVHLDMNYVMGTGLGSLKYRCY